MPRFVLSLALMIGGLACASGCGGSLPPVQGRATVDGATLDSGTVKFYPENSPTNVTAEGFITGGGFIMITGENPGVPTGKYKVTVTPSPTQDPLKKQVKIPAKYQEVADTTLIITVVGTSEPGAYDLKMTSK